MLGILNHPAHKHLRQLRMASRQKDLLSENPKVWNLFSDWNHRLRIPMSKKKGGKKNTIQQLRVWSSLASEVDCMLINQKSHPKNTWLRGVQTTETHFKLGKKTAIQERNPGTTGYNSTYTAYWFTLHLKNSREKNPQNPHPQPMKKTVLRANPLEALELSA